MNLPNIPGGKKPIYTQIPLPLAAVFELEEAKIVATNKGLR